MLIKYIRHIKISKKPNFIVVSKNNVVYYMDTLISSNKIHDFGAWKIKYKN